MKTFNPDKQFAYTRDLPRVYMGEAPTLGVVSLAFGENITEIWLAGQLRNLSEYAGCKEKLSVAQISEIARVIISTWGYLKVTEMMHFFLKFKAGEYGKFYGAVDALAITEALREFVKERYDLIGRFRKAEEDARRAAEKQQTEAVIKAETEARRVANLTIPERLIIGMWTDRHGEADLTDCEIAEIAWLFKLGFETAEARRIAADYNAEYSKFINLINAI